MAEETFIDTDVNESASEHENSMSSVQMLRSELAQEIISRKAGFLEKWSLIVFLGILLLAFGGTWFVHYPDVVTTPAVLTAENNPKELRINQEGRLIKLFVKNNQLVRANEDIAWMESLASHSEVNELLKEINEGLILLSGNQLQKITSNFKINLNNLGEIQSDFEQFLLAESAFNDYISNPSNLARAKSDRTPDKAKIAFQQQLLFLKNKVMAWKDRYELTANGDGRISISGDIKETDYLRAGSVLGYLLPENNKYFLEAIISQNNFGKINTGMRVQIRLDAYPYEEWGFLNGTISYISSVPSGSGFLSIIQIDKDAITNNKRKLVLKTGLRAQAIIITKDIRLLQKFYYGFVKSSSINK